MAEYQLTLLRRTDTIRKTVFVQPAGSTRPPNGTNLPSFEHDASTGDGTETVETGPVDLEIPSMNHVLYHHVQDACYRAGIEDMQTVDIRVLPGNYVSVPANTAAPTITGTPRVGVELTLGNGTWTGSPAFTYKWFFAPAPNGVFTEVAGATTNKLTPVTTNAGGVYKGEVTGTNAAGTVRVESAVVGPVAAAE